MKEFESKWNGIVSTFVCHIFPSNPQPHPNPTHAVTYWKSVNSFFAMVSPHHSLYTRTDNAFLRKEGK